LIYFIEESFIMALWRLKLELRFGPYV